MNIDKIEVVGANENNLKNISLAIDKHCLNVVTGVSGSGKSSLVFDCIYAMAQAEFYETLSTYAVKNLPKINRPDAAEIRHLSPCVLVEQRKLGSNPRATVGTYTEIYTYLRLLYSRIGQPAYDSSYFSFNTPKGACHKCGGLGVEMVVDLDKLLDLDKSLNQGAVLHRTWKVGSRYFNIQKATGYFDMDKKLRDYTPEEMDKLLYHKPTNFTNQSVGFIQNWSYEGIVHRLIKRQSDARGLQINDYDREFLKESPCLACGGTRLNARALSVKVHGHDLKELLNLEIADLYELLGTIDDVAVTEIIGKMRKDARNLIDLGIGYLTLNRGIGTLSSGEAQKIKLAHSLGSTLNELVYVMDEPSLGFHARDVKKTIEVIHELVAKGNTAIVVEHNRQIINQADQIIDIGPGAGQHGGEIIYQGDVAGLLANDHSATGQCLRRRTTLAHAEPATKFYEAHDINIHNIHHLDVKIPLGRLVCVTGVSGSGKSSLVQYLLQNDHRLIKVGKDNVGLSARSNVATYTKVFDKIRALFAQANGVSASEFSFNAAGACHECGGLGVIRMDMHFLGDVQQACGVCHGNRYKSEILKYEYCGKNINDVLNMNITEALHFFKDVPEIVSQLTILDEVGLGYLELGQSFDTLSGGEIQRINLSKYLVKRGSIYVFDEPTQGLHLRDIEKLQQLMRKMVQNGNTIIAVEHNLDFIVGADYLIDMGPDSGRHGGRIIFSGSVAELVQVESYTGAAVREYLAQ